MTRIERFSADLVELSEQMHRANPPLIEFESVLIGELPNPREIRTTCVIRGLLG